MASYEENIVAHYESSGTKEYLTFTSKEDDQQHSPLTKVLSTYSAKPRTAGMIIGAVVTLVVVVVVVVVVTTTENSSPAVRHVDGQTQNNHLEKGSKNSND